MLFFKRPFKTATVVFLLLCAPNTGMSQNLCSVANGHSIAQAQDSIIRGDQIRASAGDCSHINWPTCEEAENYYRHAARHIEQVLAAAKVDGCLTCDMETIGEFSERLYHIEAQMINEGYNASFADVHLDYLQWKDAPYCSGGVVGEPPVAPSQPQGPIVLSTCAPISVWEYSVLDTPAGTLMFNTDLPTCANECENNSWCKSFDFDWQNTICTLRDVNLHDVVIEINVNGSHHYECGGRQ